MSWVYFIALDNGTQTHKSSHSVPLFCVEELDGTGMGRDLPNPTVVTPRPQHAAI